MSISTRISPAALTNIVNLADGYTANNYSLQHDNCADFSITACALAGLNLPDIQGTWVGVFHGSNPGNLGESMKTMALPSGATRNTTGGNAPSNTGGC